MKLLKEMISKHHYVEESETQGSSKMAGTLLECPKDYDLQLASIHQARNVDICEGN